MAQPEPYLTIRAVRPIVSGLRNLGHDPEPILAAADIDPVLLDNPDAQVSMRQGVALFIHGMQRTGDADLGLHLAEHADLSSLDVHFHAMLSSSNLQGAYERLCRYQRLIHETTRVTLSRTGDTAQLRHEMPGGLAVPRQSAEFIVAAWVRGGRVITRTDWAPSEVRFAHPTPESTGEHARFFGCPVRFSAGENSIIFPTSLLALPCAGTDASLLAILDRYADDRLDRAPQSEKFADRVRTALADLLRDGEPSATRLAARLKMSVRTLNRALAAEQTTYRELLAQLRQEAALRLLRDRHVAIAEAAFQTGFTELSAFYRAFRRWTGQTPAEFRQQISRRP